jgi:hypothetical protein
MAAERNNDPCRVQLKDVILSYPNLFRAKAFGKGEGEPAFSANFLLDKGSKLGKTNIGLIEDAIDAAKDAKWNGKSPKIKSDKIFFKDGDSEDYEDAEENHGMMIVTSRNYKKPRTLDRDKQDCVEADDILYGGARVDAIVRVWAQDNDWGVRINCSVEAVRFREDGDRFGSAPVDPDEFDDLPSEGGSRSRRSRDDDEDEKPSRSRRGRDEEEEEKPSRSRRSRDDDEDEKPSRSRRGRDEEEEEKPSRSRRSRDDDEDEKPSRSRRGRDEEEEEKPSRSRRARDQDDDEDRPSRNSRARRNHDDV